MPAFASQDLDQVISEIAKRTAGMWRPIVAVDGTAGVGKSYLAKHAARRLYALHIELDKCLSPGAAYLLGYTANSEFDALRRAIDIAVGGVILSGTCARDALYGLGRDAAVHVYVKCWDTFRDCWEDEEICDFVAISDVPSDATPRERELMEYHAIWQPHRRANIEWRNAVEHLPRRADRRKPGLNDNLAAPSRA